MKWLFNKAKFFINHLQDYADQVWYGPVIGFFALLDNLVIIIPTDGILISSAMLKPKKWFYFALSVALGSTLGALSLAYLVEDFGLPAVLKFYPDLNTTTTWITINDFFQKHGLLCVFLVSLSPLMQQPAVVIASLAATPYYSLTLVVFAGRFIKFIVFSYIGSHAPNLISKLWGVKDDLKAVGVNEKINNKN